LPGLVGEVAGSTAERDRRVRDHDVDPAERVERRPDELRDVGGFGGVAGDGDAADLVRDRPDRLLAAPADDDPGSLLREPPRSGGTDPGAATAHDRDLALESHA
jgi:hypothetical protein